jgi:hypothetical protein
MAEITLQVGFLEMLAVPLDREQRLDVLAALARQADWLSADDVLLAAALLDHAARHRVDGRAIPVEEVAEIKSRYIERLVTEDDPDVARILDEAMALRERHTVVH